VPFKSVPNNAKRLEKTLNQRFFDGIRASPITKSMDPLPAHIRPEDEVYFRQPLPLRPMDFRARWVLGFKILIAAQGVWLPMVLIFGVLERFDEDVPIAVGLAALPASLVLAPLWAALLFRHWTAGTMTQRLANEVLAVPTHPLGR